MVWSVNGTHDFLVRNGVTPDFFAMVDARRFNDFAKKPQKNCVYLIASQCYPGVFDRLKDHRPMLWHCGLTEEQCKEVDKIFLKGNSPLKSWTRIGARGTIGLTSTFLAYTLGFDTMYLMGFDSSFDSDKHAYPQPQNDSDEVVNITIDDEVFYTTPALADQVEVYREVNKKLTDAGVNIIMESEGLIKVIHHKLSAKE